MKKSRAKEKLFLHVAVLQNGARQADAYFCLNRRRAIKILANQGPLALPHYPLPDGQLEICRTKPGGVDLLIEAKWEGFCTAAGEMMGLERVEKGRREVVMSKGDYASIARDDLRILLKVTDRPIAHVGAAIPSSFLLGKSRGTWRAGFLSHFFRERIEYGTLAAAFGIGLFLIGSVILGLFLRPYDRPHLIKDIQDEYMLSFIAPEHFVQAPELLQEKLDRSRYPASVLSYYESLAGMLDHANRYDESFMMRSSVELFADRKTRTEDNRSTYLSAQSASDATQLTQNGTAVISIPAILGESLGGRMLRVIDKVGIVHEAINQNFESKKLIANEFLEDPEYNYEEYRNVQGMSRAAKSKLAQIRVGGATNEEQMYAEGLSLRDKAKAIQDKTQASHHSKVTERDNQIIGLAKTPAKEWSVVAVSDFNALDDKLNGLTGSDYGGPKPKTAPKEPLIGEIEPSLIEKHIKQNRYQLQICYELALRRNESAFGTMEWRWRIDSRGLTSDLALVSSGGIKDQKMIQCIQAKISKWRFPRPRRGSVEVSYPFEFRPAKG